MVEVSPARMEQDRDNSRKVARARKEIERAWSLPCRQQEAGKAQSGALSLVLEKAPSGPVVSLFSFHQTL